MPRGAGWTTAAKDVLCSAYKYSGLMAVHEWVRHRAGATGAAVLLFHRVTDEIPEDGLTVGTGRFRRICRLLRDNFRVVPLGEVHRLARSAAPLPRRTVAVTFDDSYRDNLAAAHTLAEFGLPACFFLPADYVGTERVYPWDRHLGVRLANLSWEDVREMAALGFEFGSHTRSHADLAQAAPAAARREIVDSKHIIEDKLGRPVHWFAYPFGGREHFRRELLGLVEGAGYRACFSAFGGMVYRGAADPVLPREPVAYFHSVRNLEAHLAGCLHWVYACKQSMARAVAGPGAEAVGPLDARPEPVGPRGVTS